MWLISVNSSFKWGILGASKFAFEQMAPAIHAAKGNSLVALATKDSKKAKKFLALSDTLNIHCDYNDLLEDPNIDAVYIPLPNHLHIEWAMRCLKAGKHVLCEKPISMVAEEIDGLIELRDRTQLLAAEAYMVVHHPQWQLAKEFVDSGKLGKLVQIDGVFSYNNADDPMNIRNQAQYGGGGIPDIGVYPYGVSRFVTGLEPSEILFVDIVFENGVDTWANVSAQFPGFKMQAVTSMRSAPRQEMTIQGAEGFLKLTAPFNPNVYDIAKVTFRKGNEKEQVFKFPAANHYVNQVEAFSLAATTDEAYGCTLEFSKGTQTMIDMVYEKNRKLLQE